MALTGVNSAAQGLVLARRDIAVIKHPNLPRLFCRKSSLARKRPFRSRLAPVSGLTTEGLMEVSEMECVVVSWLSKNGKKDS
jgi:hypothetical protein